MGPWSHRTLFQLAPAHFPQPLPKPPHGVTVLCMVAARPMREATESGGCFCIPSAPAARPLGNVRKGPPAGLPSGSQIPTYSSFGVHSLSARGGTSIAMCQLAVWVRGHARGGGGGAGPAFGPAPFLLGVVHVNTQS